jgi:transcriptional regulator with XRE-family HTH domain
MAKALTLPELADRAGLSKGLLWKIETDESSNPSLSTLYKIAESLEMTLADILESERVVVKQPPSVEKAEWAKELLNFLKSQGKEPDHDILNAIQLLRNRKAAKNKGLEHLKFLYTSIENSFKK